MLNNNNNNIVWSKAKHVEEIASMKLEVDRLDLLIVHSPERAAQERAIMEDKVCELLFFVIVDRDLSIE